MAYLGRCWRWVLAACFVFLTVAGVARAAGGFTARQVEALYGGIEVYVDGRQVDTGGVEPFLLADRGVLVVPVRPLGKALGKPVTWDENAARVYLGEAGPGKEPAPAVPPARLEDVKVLRNVGEFYRQDAEYFYIASRPFAGGIAVELAKDGRAETVVEPGGKYKILEGYLGVEDETQDSSGAFYLTVYGDDGQLYRSPLVKPAAYPLLMRVDVAGVKRLTLAVEWAAGGTGEYDRLIAVLASGLLKP